MRVNPNEPVNMIRHNRIGIQPHMWKMSGNVQPTGGRNLTRNVQPHLSIYNFAEQTGPIMGADGHEIRPFPAVIKPGQTERTALV